MDFHVTAKTATLNHMADYLKTTGRPTKGLFTCLAKDHEDSTPSMSYNPENGTIHCFGCGMTLDLFNLIGIDNDIYDNTEKLKAAKLLYPDIVDLDANGNPATKDPKSTALNWDSVIKKSSKDGREMLKLEDILEDKNRDNRTPEQIKDDTELFRLCALNCAENPEALHEWTTRGLNVGTVERFNLGYESNYPHFRRVAGATEHHKQGYNAPILTIPYLDLEGAGILRNQSKGIDKKDRYDTRGPKRLYNKTALLNNKEYIFICEGEIDGLSVYESGYDSFLSLGSTANAKQLLRELQNKDIPEKNLIVLLDNDDAGKKAAQEIKEHLTDTAKFFCYVPTGFYPDGVKDINDYLLLDPDGLRQALGRIIAEAQDAKEKEIKERAEQYTKDNSVLSVLDTFKGDLGKPNTTPIYSTGFQYLDHGYLSGGLHGQSLIIIGALSSAGKTTFIQQIADNIAESGKDVILFSLEMSTSELIAKSVSRLTYRIVREKGLDTSNAKTVFGILDGAKYSNYSTTEIDLIHDAVEYYRQRIAPYMYIVEGMGDVTVIPSENGQTSISEKVEEHIKQTGRRPVVIVDYLQILAPYNARSTDKQNTDKAVLELKRIARDNNIPVIAISSMNRESYNAPITLSSYKESGAVEYSSDVLLGLQFNGQSDKIITKTGKIVRKTVDIEAEKARNPRYMELVLLKNRNGPITDMNIYYDFFPMFGYFEEKGIMRPDIKDEREKEKEDTGEPDGVAIEV